jgi:hypothetical protein
MSVEEKVRHILEKWTPRYDCKGNDSVAVGRVREAEAKDGDKKTAGDISKIIEALGGEIDEKGNRKIVYAPIVSQALETAKAEHAFYNYNSLALEKMVLDKCEACDGFSIKRYEDLSDVMDWLEANDKIPLSRYGEEHKYLQAQAKRYAERQLQLLSSILQGRKNTTYEQWSQEHAKIIYVDVASLKQRAGESEDAHLSRLERIEREVLDLRRKQSQSREDQRQEQRQIADSNREHRIYRKGDKDSLDRDAVPTRWGSDDKSPISVRTEARKGETDRAVVVVDAAAAAVSTDPFISPSGYEYTKKEVYGLSKDNLVLFRKLMNTDHNRLNRILAGN